MKQSFTQLLHWLKSLRPKTIFLLTFIAVVLIATTISLSNTFLSASKQLKDKIQGEEIGNNKLRYKHGEYIYNPETGKILIDSIDWLHVAYGDTIGILAKNKRRAYINLNSAELITPLEYEKAWAFSCNRGVMVKNDTIFIFRRDGSLINPDGFKYKGQYELIFHHDKLVVNVDNDTLQRLMDNGGLGVCGNFQIRQIRVGQFINGPFAHQFCLGLGHHTAVRIAKELVQNKFRLVLTVVIAFCAVFLPLFLVFIDEESVSQKTFMIFVYEGSILRYAMIVLGFFASWITIEWFSSGDRTKKWGYYVASTPHGIAGFVFSKYIFMAFHSALYFAFCILFSYILRFVGDCVGEFDI